MKRTFQLFTFLSLAFFSIAFFTSCEDGSEDIEINQTHLSGNTWTYSKVESDAPGAELIAAFFDGYEYTFYEDGTYTSYDAVFEFEEEGTWDYSKDKLIFDAGTEFEEVYSVTELSKNTLKLFQTVEDEDTGDSFDMTLVFKR